MSQYTRSSAENQRGNSGLGGNILLARVISHLDPTFMGSLEVTLLRDQGNTAGDDAQTYIVKYASPFYGYTPFEFMGNNDGSKSTIEGFNDTQKSYGMWMVPPDVGVNVLVLFVEGDPSQGYWFACVPGRYVNNMTPAIAGSTAYELDSVDKERYGSMKGGDGGTLPLPVAEVNKRINGEKQEIDPDKIKKPVHPIADRFLEQGLLEDDVRGVSRSSPRREAPSAVFGISSPGPLDRRTNAKKAVLGKRDNVTETPVPVSRLGGTQIVMDDGDDRYHRTAQAADGPVKYVDITQAKAGEKWEPTTPLNEYFRVRTRTGHQLLMHNSEDLIYISNARGTAWIELTSNGKIDIYAADSISIHTENDLNLFANRDINFEAGRNFNIKTGGRLKADISTDYEIAIGASGKITVASNWDQKIGGTTKIASAGDLNVVTAAAAKYTSSGNTNIAAVGEIIQSGAEIHMNGKLAEVAAVAAQVVPLTTHANIQTSYEAGWNKKYQSGTIKSIMKRIPMHEPWALHENQAPDQLGPDNTDREVQ